jgi:hypothetical protein
MKSVLRRAKVIGDPISRVAALEAGFRYAYLRRFQGYPFDAPSIEDLTKRHDFHPEAQEVLAMANSKGMRFTPDPRFVNREVFESHRAELDKFLSRLNSNLSCIEAIAAFEARHARLRLLVGGVSKFHDAWLRAGVGVFVASSLLGFDLFVADDEEGRAVMGRNDVRSTCSVLIGALEDLEWPPDRIEHFFLEKVVPHLHEPGIRRWVFALNMAVMSDLRSLASEADKANSVASIEERVVGSVKALIESIPIVGKALAVLIFGEKKK